MSRLKEWDEMVKSSKDAIEDFNDFADDKAIVWADDEIKNYKRAMLILARANSNFCMSLSDDESKFINTMILRAESITMSGIK